MNNVPTQPERFTVLRGSVRLLAAAALLAALCVLASEPSALTGIARSAGLLFR